MEEKLKTVLSKTHQEFADVRYSVYRTALKLCRLLKSLKLNKIEVSNALSLLSQPMEGLSSSGPDQAFPDINLHGLKCVSMKIFAQCQANLGNEDVFPDVVGELVSLLVFHIYSKDGDSAVSLQAVRTFFIVMCRRELIAKYKSLFWCHCEPGNNTLAKQDVSNLLLNLVKMTEVIHEQSHFENIKGAVESCFSQIHGYGITEFEFVQWLLLEPQSIVWIPTMHRLITAEASIHHVACMLCKSRPITGIRFRCLRCMDYNLCQNCFLVKTNHRKSHKPTHPIQEYVRPSSKSDSFKDMARTIRNMITKRYKSKAASKSFLPIKQTGSQNTIVDVVDGCCSVFLCVKETRQEQTLEMTSASVQSRASSLQQNLKLSRMSAGFADISQLADEEKEQLDLLIERLDEERRRVAATTQLLSSVQPDLVRDRSSSEEENPRSHERMRLKSELKNVRDYNRELEKELEEMRYNLHSGDLSHASTPHGGAMSHIHTPQRPHSSPGYYRPDDTIVKQVYAEQFRHSPHDIAPSAASSELVEPPSTTSYGPHSSSEGVRKLPGYSPRLRSQSYEIGASKSRSPMKAHPHSNAHPNSQYSTPHDCVMNAREFSSQFQSLGNSPTSAGSLIGEKTHKPTLASHQLLPDAPIIRMGRHAHDESPAPSMKSGKSHFSRPGNSPEIFDGASPEMMLKSISASMTEGRQSKRSSAPSSRSSLAEQRISPALLEAYHRHLEATGKSFGSEYSTRTCSRKSNSRKSSKDYESDSLSESARSTPKIQTRNHQNSGKISQKPLLDLSSSVTISSDSLGSGHNKFKPIATETHVGTETGNLIHSYQHETSPFSRSSTPKVMSIAAYVREPGDLMGSFGSSVARKRNDSPASISSRDHPRSHHSRSRTSTPKVVDPLITTQPDNLVDKFNPKEGTHTRQRGRSAHVHSTNLVDSFTSGSVPRMSTSSSHKSRSCTSTPKFDIKRDSHGSFVPPRRVLSQENLNFKRSRNTSADSSSTEGSVSHSSEGFKTGDLSSAENHRNPTYLKEFDPYSSIYAGDADRSRHKKSPKFQTSISQESSSTLTSHKKSHDQSSMSDTDPDINKEGNKEFPTHNRKKISSAMNSHVHSDAKSKLKHKRSKNKEISSDSRNEISSTINSYSSISDAGFKMNKKTTEISSTLNSNSSISDAGFKMNKKAHSDQQDDSKNKKQMSSSCDRSSMSDAGFEMHKNFPRTINPAQSSIQQTSSSTMNSYDPMSDTGPKMSKKARPQKPRRNPTKQHIKTTEAPKSSHHKRSRSSASSKRNSSNSSSKRTSPKLGKKVATSSSDENVTAGVKTVDKGFHRTSHSTDGFRSTPEGDIEMQFLRSEDELRFENPEEEMKYLVSKLQSLMPSMFDEDTDPEKSSPLKKAHPMCEVLVAAEQTRKAIELFTEYAVAVSAGEEAWSL